MQGSLKQFSGDIFFFTGGSVVALLSLPSGFVRRSLVLYSCEQCYFFFFSTVEVLG